MLSAPSGSTEWWRAVAETGTPLIRLTWGHSVQVTFLYREASLAIERVLIDVNGVTDHHSVTPQSLERLPGTDVWKWETRLPADWRGSYAFIPLCAPDAAPAICGTDAERQAQQRAWWRRIASLSRPDPLNRMRAHPTGWGGLASALHLPGALDQTAWSAVDGGAVAPETPTAFTWHSAIQGKQRTVWHRLTGSPAPAGVPLVLLLDGRNWVERMPIAAVLDAETNAGRLPPALYLLVDSIDPQHRERDLPPNPDFWRAIAEELLPLAGEIAPITPDPAWRIVAGQSYGGLAALYATVERPDCWGGVIAQSPSLWWPDASLIRGRTRRPDATGELARRLRHAGRSPRGLRVFMEVGNREDVMIDLAEDMARALVASGSDVALRTYEGGHDALCWRGGLIDGLRWLMAGRDRVDDEPGRSSR